MEMKIKKFEELSKIVPILTYQRLADENTIVVSVDKLSFALKCLKLHFFTNTICYHVSLELIFLVKTIVSV